MPCLVISLAGPIPDLNKICGEPNAPEDKRTSLSALIVNKLPSETKQSTPVALFPSKTI